MVVKGTIRAIKIAGKAWVKASEMVVGILTPRVIFVILFILATFLSVSHLQAETGIENVHFEQSGNQVYIYYDLIGDQKGYDIGLKLSSDGGKTFDTVPKSVSGDIGEKVSPGRNKCIIWDVTRDVRQLSGNKFVFMVFTKVPEISVIDNMVLIPAGEFLMGSNNGDSNESPVHKVYVDAFYMGKYEVTAEEYCKFLNEVGNPGNKYVDMSGGCTITRSTGHYVPKSGCAKKPINEVSWYGAVEYCKWLSKKTGKNYRLPTEAEWEKAARGGLVGKEYPWGNESPEGRANYNREHREWESPRETLKDVGSYPPNGYGLYDMAGNVCEWCSDLYSQDYYRSSPERNPKGYDPKGRLANTLKLISQHVLRGGSWMGNELQICCANRFNGQGFHVYSCGFRIARDF